MGLDSAHGSERSGLAHQCGGQPWTALDLVTCLESELLNLWILGRKQLHIVLSSTCMMLFIGTLDDHLITHMRLSIVHNSKGVLVTTLIGTRFRIYAVIFNISLHKDLGKLVLLIMLLTISTSVLFWRSTTSFYCGILGIVY